MNIIQYSHLVNNNCEFLLRRQYIYFHSSKELRCKWIPKTDFTMRFLICRRKIPSANNTLFSNERIETLIGGVKQAKYATEPSGKENAKSQ